jgi:hypothetical protein
MKSRLLYTLFITQTLGGSVVLREGVKIVRDDNLFLVVVCMLSALRDLCVVHESSTSFDSVES